MFTFGIHSLFCSDVTEHRITVEHLKSDFAFERRMKAGKFQSIHRSPVDCASSVQHLRPEENERMFVGKTNRSTEDGLPVVKHSFSIDAKGFGTRCVDLH